MLALLPFIFGNWLIAAIMVHVIAFAFYMGVAYLGGKLFGPDMPETDSGPTANAQSRSWNPHSTQQEGLARPRAYGRNMHHGNIVAKWTEVVGDREKLYMIVEYGDGPTKGVVYEDGEPLIFLNDQPITNFTTVDIQERLGTLNQTCMTGFEKTKLEYPQSTELLKNEPIIVTTPNDYFDDLEYTILFPNGLRKYHKSGGTDTAGITLKVRIREHPAGAWTEIFNESIRARTLEPYFKLYKVNTLEPGYVDRGKQYDFEFTNLSGPSERHVCDIYLRSFREVVDIAFTRPGKALVGISAVATEALSGSLDVKVVREDKLIRVYNGTSWSIEYSRNRAWVTYDAFTQPVISGDGSGEDPWVVESYEGMGPEHLYLPFFYSWAEFCSDQIPDGYGGTEDRLACDTILDFQTDVWTFANEIANVGRAHLYWQGHILTGWIDKATTVSGLVTMDNVMARSWKSNWSEKDELAGKVEVFFNDSRQGYERTHAALPNEDAGRYTRIIAVEGVGITTRGTAIHVANHALLRNKLIRNVNSFRQYKEAFRYHLGDTIRLQIPRWGESYRVRSSSANNKVKLDRTCSATVGEHLFLQSYDEAQKKIRVDSYTVQSVVDKVVTITTTWEVTPLKNYMVAIGEEGEVKQRRITDMGFRSDNYVDVTVEIYDTDLFTADALVPDLPDQNYIWAKPANPLTRPVTREEVIELIGQLAIPQLDIDVPHTSNCKWSGNAVDTISWDETDADEPIIFRYKGTSYEITPDDTTDYFVYWDPEYTTSFRTTDDAAVAVAIGGAGQRWMMCRNVKGVAYPTIPIMSLHAGVLQVGTITAALAQIADAAIETAKIADLAVETLKIKDNAVTIPVDAYEAGIFNMTGNYQTIISVALTSTGNPVHIKCSWLYWDSQDMLTKASVQLIRKVGEDETTIYGPVEICTLSDIAGSLMASFSIRNTPGENEVTYYLEAKEEEEDAHVRFSNRSIMALEVKK